MRARRRTVRTVEGVSWYPYRVTFRLADGTRRRIVRWSPGYPWVRAEVGRELVERFGADGLLQGSASITLDM